LRANDFEFNQKLTNDFEELKVLKFKINGIFEIEIQRSVTGCSLKDLLQTTASNASLVQPIKDKILS